MKIIIESDKQRLRLRLPTFLLKVVLCSGFVHKKMLVNSKTELTKKDIKKIVRAIYPTIKKYKGWELITLSSEESTVRIII